MTTRSHHDHVEMQFGSQASAYLTSAVHASGRDLQRLAERLADFPQAHVLDIGCGRRPRQLCGGRAGCTGDGV